MTESRVIHLSTPPRFPKYMTVVTCMCCPEFVQLLIIQVQTAQQVKMSLSQFTVSYEMWTLT